MASDALKRFTKRAKRVLKAAQEEAENLRHPYIGTEHMLLGLIHEEGCMALKVLYQLGIDPRDVVQAVNRLVDARDKEVDYAPELTPRTKRVIQLAVEEARLMEHQYIGTEHLLLGLMREQEGLAGGVLRRLGVDLEEVRELTQQSSLGARADNETPSWPAPREYLEGLGETPSRSLPVHVGEEMRWLRLAEGRLAETLGREPDLEELAAETGLPVRRLRWLKRVSQRLFWLEVMEGLREEIQGLLNLLTRREAQVLRLRYGFQEDGKPHTVKEVAEILGMTQEQVRQIESKALRRLRKPYRSKRDSDAALRAQLLALLQGGNAHLTFEDAVADFPMEAINRRAPNVDFSPWQFLEHIRIAQWDILEFVRNPDHVSPQWPEGYWPAPIEEADEAAWQATLEGFRSDMASLQEMVADPATDLTADLPHAEGYNALREVLLVADHNAYHIGEFALLRQVMGTWPKDRGS